MSNHTSTIKVALVGVLCVCYTSQGYGTAAWNDHVLNTTINARTTGPSEVKYVVTVAFRRDAFGGDGAPVAQPAATGGRYCPTCPVGALPQRGT